MRTTRNPQIDIENVFPDLKHYRKSTIRLHPIQHENLSWEKSKFGGQFIWPSDEIWPVCDERIYQDDFSSSIGTESWYKHCENYVSVIQIYKKDVPEFEMPDNKDMMQILWCPEDHVEYNYSPKCLVFWRNSTDIINRKTEILQPTNPKKEYLVKTCSINPEKVIEYPSLTDLYNLIPELAQRISNWEMKNEEEPIYQYHLSVADGSKLGGYVHWIQEPEIPICSCKRNMEHLLTISDSEFDGGSFKRWCPEEYIDNIWQLSYDDRKMIQSPLNISLGDMGKIYIFVCKHCFNWPIKSFFQCS